MADPREYMYFYLIGRQEDELTSEVDLTALAERVLAGEKMRDVTYQVALDAAKANEHNGHRRDWLIDNRDEIAEAGGDENKAYALYQQGCVDELAHGIENDLMGEIIELLDDIELGEAGGDADDEEDEEEEWDEDTRDEDDDEEDDEPRVSKRGVA